jgi:hypothetical protein
MRFIMRWLRFFGADANMKKRQVGQWRRMQISSRGYHGLDGSSAD